MREQGQQAIQPFGSTTKGRFNYGGSRGLQAPESSLIKKWL